MKSREGAREGLVLDHHGQPNCPPLPLLMGSPPYLKMSEGFPCTPGYPQSQAASDFLRRARPSCQSRCNGATRLVASRHSSNRSGPGLRMAAGGGCIRSWLESAGYHLCRGHASSRAGIVVQVGLILKQPMQASRNSRPNLSLHKAIEKSTRQSLWQSWQVTDP